MGFFWARVKETLTPAADRRGGGSLPRQELIDAIDAGEACRYKAAHMYDYGTLTDDDGVLIGQVAYPDIPTPPEMPPTIKTAEAIWKIQDTRADLLDLEDIEKIKESDIEDILLTEWEPTICVGGKWFAFGLNEDRPS